MEYRLMEKIAEEVKNNRRVAMVVLTKVMGSTPREEGSMMLIFEDGSIEGTIGGGKLEYTVINEGKKCLKQGISKNYNYKLTDEDGSLHMQCGGTADVFVKVFMPNNKLLIAGGGHISLKLYELAKMLDFHTVILDDREEYCNRERFPEADELIAGDIYENLKNYPIDSNCFVVIVTRGHENDEKALASVVDRGAKYVGMIGSKNKTQYTMKNLIDGGYDKESLSKVYAPIGLALGGESPIEIAFSIISEILLVKNGGSLKHMKIME